jgi:hypothetical protein
LITYVVKNIDDFPLILKFVDGSKVNLRPDRVYLWQGPEENTDFLQQYVDAGKLDVWTFEADFASRQFERRNVTLYQWQSEGF